MKKKILGMLICMLLIVSTVLPAIGSMNIKEKVQSVNYIPGWILVIAPNGGEQLSGYVYIIWDWGGAGPICPMYYNIYYQKMGQSWHELSVDWETCCIFRWNTQTVSNGQYKVKVQLWFDCDLDGHGELFWGEDISDGWFTIFNNYPPKKPNNPSGPQIGVVGEAYIYSTSATDPEDDNIKYGWDWDGDDNVNEWTDFYISGATVNTEHTWETAGTYNVKVKAEDEHGAQSDFSSELTVYISDNIPPNKPSIGGPISGEAGNSYTYYASTSDPDGNHIHYMFDWDDGTISEWKGAYKSGEICEVSHIWEAQGSYSIKVKAKDIYDAESLWSDPLSVTMPRNKMVIHSLIEWLMEHFSILYQ